jgi:hypothetical protein
MSCLILTALRYVKTMESRQWSPRGGPTLAQRRGAVLVLLVFAIGCRKTKVSEGNKTSAEPHPRPQQETTPITVDEALRLHQNVLAEQSRTEQKQPAEQRQNVPATDETAKRERAPKVVHQKPTADKLPGARRRNRHSLAKAPPTRKETSGAGATAHATLHFRNDAGDTFRLVDARFVMDGADLATVINAAERGKSYVVFSGDLSSGRHAVIAHLTYQGANHGVFTYANGYTFKVESDEILTIRGAQAVSFTIICKERTGLTDGAEKRLVVTVEGRRAA